VVAIELRRRLAQPQVVLVELGLGVPGELVGVLG
jgi:hypothetical protein